MLSTPPAMNRSPCPLQIASAALLSAWRLEPHSRFTVCPGTSTGKPARSVAIRATFRLSSPDPFAFPRITSSIPAGSMPLRSVIERSTCAAIASCLLTAEQAARMEITTIEGLATPDALHPVQEAFIAEDAMQCGYCTSGMVISAAALLERTPHPTDTEIRESLAGNLCRCGVYG